MENKQTEKIIYIENKNITAVQWLIRQQKHNKYFDDETIEQAKQMEEDQHCTTWYKSIANDRRELREPSINFKQYYNETYEK